MSFGESTAYDGCTFVLRLSDIIIETESSGQVGSLSMGRISVVMCLVSELDSSVGTANEGTGRDLAHSHVVLVRVQFVGEQSERHVSKT